MVIKLSITIIIPEDFNRTIQNIYFTVARTAPS